MHIPIKTVDNQRFIVLNPISIVKKRFFGEEIGEGKEDEKGEVRRAVMGDREQINEGLSGVGEVMVRIPVL